MAPHPYAEAWPLLGTDDAAALADDIRANGLRDPIVTYQGAILDGRNRHAACLAVGVKPTFAEFAGDDDAALAFVQSVNNARRHQSKGSLAASWALSMLAAGKRASGRWAYGAVDSQNSGKADAEMRRLCGVIADHAPDLLLQVRDDELSLNAAHRQAEQRRDAERDRLAREERLAAEEADARTFIEETAPDLAARVDGSDLLTFVEARDLWNRRNREEAERLRREKAEAEKKAADERRARSDLYSGMARGLQVIGGYGEYEDIPALMAEYDPTELNPVQYAREFEISKLRSARRFIDALIQWKERQ